MPKSKTSKSIAVEDSPSQRAAFARALARSEFGKHYWDQAREKIRQADTPKKKSKRKGAKKDGR